MFSSLNAVQEEGGAWGGIFRVGITLGKFSGVIGYVDCLIGYKWILIWAQRRITTRDAEKLTDAPWPTIKVGLAELVKRRLLVRHGQGRGSWYGLPPQQGEQE